MDLTIIRIHVKKILTGNFVFMSLVAIIFGIAGTFVRFIQDSFLFTSIGNVLLIIGSVIAISTVFKIMK